jgi:phosphopantothenoylcysteine decarboxylase / phosphopantothenate---cysteine ligase
VLKNKKILLGISGGIAAYKTPLLVRLLVQAGAEVQVILTPSAASFVSELTLSTLSKRPALSEYTYQDSGAEVWNSHVELGIWADLFVIAPLTANSLAKMALGQSDNLLVATYLSARCPVIAAPAMDLDMYIHPSVVRNIDQLKEDGVQVLDAAEGELASGLVGKGRMPEPEDLFNHIKDFFKRDEKWASMKILINAGPTYEAIDPVRFIGNHSSGKMGLALALEAQKRGAEVYFVHGPMANPPKSIFFKQIPVISAKEMNEACQNIFPHVQVAILSAAVADYRPSKVADQKIKKADSALDIALEPTVDVLKSLGEKKKDQILVGFALETENALENGQKKLKNKNLDLIVVNSPSSSTGFGTDTNQAILLDKKGNTKDSLLVTKSELSVQILDSIENLWNV